MKKIQKLAIIAILGLMACDSQQKTDKKIEEMEVKQNDPHSYARAGEAVVKHLNWQADVDFEAKRIIATANWDIENISGVDTIYFDTKNLNIEEVRLDGAEQASTFVLHPEEDILGSKLAIPIQAKTQRVSIKYHTTKGADALQFLDPQQTADKTHPFLFTQSQAILARTWLPCQDSPGIRFSYEANVKVPEGMMALMSAENPTEVSANGAYKFTMDQPVPSYLMALAVGKLEYAKIGEVTGVYAEPSVIEAAAYEFAEMQNMVDTAEALYGEYRWGKYDVIVLPPSFPFGGMENPRLTFATPTIIAGDRSLTALIAHELAHSWSGNLVTNANWEDIWLNEGFTVYFENRIMEEIYGKDFANMLAILSYQDLLEEIDWLKSEGRLDDTRLKVDLEGRDPDDGLTGIPYDKGYFLLRLIEETVGREKWDAFLNTYFNNFAFEVMTTDAFVEYINKELLSENKDWKKSIRLEEWIFKPGLPDNCPDIESTKFKAVEAQLTDWKGGKEASTLETEYWMTPEWLHFVRLLPDTLSVDQMTALDEAFNFTNSGNSEIQAAWFEKVIPNNYQAAKVATENFLVEVGRRKFLVPIYKAILKSEEGKKRALTIYQKARPNYHAVSRSTLDDLLGLSKSQA